MSPDAYVNNNPLMFRDPYGLATYIVNRKLGGNKSRSTLNPLSHTFVFTTNPDGSLNHTYSWGNEFDDDGNSNWFSDEDKSITEGDVAAAREAIKKGCIEKRGGDDLDDYIDREFNRLKGSGDGLRPWTPSNNCKHSAELLIANAKRNKRKDEGKTRPSLDELYHWYKRTRPLYILLGIGG